ncbi:MAG: hypothetical protein A2W00_01395 [Candidatus Eisenbacteria bacterium RBG_16_71_46]|nr:MAG: hypothetical protein A2W00_01395 [Candidatus Eisenbacteria bacterium RBG_16_71_46]
MRWSLSIGRIAGVRVELHVTFLMFIAWIAIAQGLLGGDVLRALAAVGLLLTVFACVLLHELGHALAARRYGIQTRDIVLLPIGGLARLQRMPEEPRHEIVVALAGPAVNVVIAAALFAWLYAARQPLTPIVLGGGFIETLFAINVAMVVFNMVPAFPMDGGRVLRAALALRLPYVRATRIASLVGQGFALLFGVVGLFWGNIVLMFVGLFVFLAASEERALVETRSTLSGLPVRAAMLTEFQSLGLRDPLQRAVDHLMASNQAEFPVLDGGYPVGVLTRGELVQGLQRQGAEAPVEGAMRADDLVVEAAEPLEDVVERMRARGRSAVAVTQHGRLVGVLTLENVGDLLLVREALRRHRGQG